MDTVQYAQPMARAQAPQQRNGEVVTNQRIFEMAQLAAFQGDAVMAYGSYVMDGMDALGRKRQMLQTGDPLTDRVLAQIQVNTMFALLTIQDRMARSW